MANRLVEIGDKQRAREQLTLAILDAKDGGESEEADHLLELIRRLC
jgi:hypothetical protein